jgi:hypothetical protein
MAMTFNNPTYTLANLTVTDPTTWATTESSTIVLNGPDSDIKINGESLTKVLKTLQETLCVPGHLQRNESLEKEYQELRELGERYRQREQEFLEKRRMWNILKTTD